MSERNQKETRIEGGSVTVALPELRRQLATLASVYERADAYNRAALEPVIRRAWERATIYAEER